MLYLIEGFDKKDNSKFKDSEDDRYKYYISTDEFKDAERVYNKAIENYKHVRLKECHIEGWNQDYTIAFYDEEE